MEMRGEFRSSSKVHKGVIAGRTFGPNRTQGLKVVKYAVVDGLAIFEGDIVLGTAEALAATQSPSQRRSKSLRPGAVLMGDVADHFMAEGLVMAGVVITGSEYRWPKSGATYVVPYTVDPTLPNQARVTGAIAHWEARTKLRFPARTNEADYVTFRPGGGCSSQVGRQGGQQFITLGDGCSLGNAIHEIGHTTGLWHEQSREDRDVHVNVLLQNVEPGYEHNFDQHISDGDDVGAYDYGSIMHYPGTAFSKNGQPTIIPKPDPTVPIGQRLKLSPGDLLAVDTMYP